MTTTSPSPANETLKAACAQHERYLRGRLRGLGVSEAAFDDAVQDVFEVLVRRIGCYDSRYTLRQWMAGVARSLSTVYARLRSAKDSFERAMARRRRAERRSWLLLPMFGGSSARALGSAAFVTPIALLGVLTIGGGAALAVRGCAEAPEGGASEARAHEGRARPATGEEGLGDG